MKLEVPLLSLAGELVKLTKDLPCRTIYTQVLGLRDSDAEVLCSRSAVFSFEDKFKSAFAVMNVLLYRDRFNPEFYNEFIRRVKGRESNAENDGAAWQTMMEFRPPQMQAEDIREM